MIDKIAKLLNQAENAGTREEAATFMAKAQQLATVHGVDLARARYATLSKEKTNPIQRTVTIGLQGDRGMTTLVDLFLGIAGANDIKCTIAHNNTRVYAHGFAEDIDVSEALYASLLVQQARFAAEYKAAEVWKKETVYREGHYVSGARWGEWVDGEEKPITWLTARLSFQDGFAGSIRSRLSTAKYEEIDRQRKLDEDRARRPHLDDEGHATGEFASWLEMNHGIDLDDLDDETGTIAELSEILRDVDDEWTQELLAQWKEQLLVQQATGPSTELVLAAKSEAVDKFYDESNPHLRRRRPRCYQGSQFSGSTGSRSAGREAGNRASLGGNSSISNKKEIGR